MKTEQDEGARMFGAEEYEKCLDIMLRESDMVRTISGIQLLVKEAVMNREWTDFESLMTQLERIGAEFRDLDAERAGLFSEGDGRVGFYALCAQLPGEARSKITQQYRNLKIEITRVRLENEALLEYLNEARLLVAGFLEAILPERKGKIYSPRGMQIEAEMPSLVVNTRL
jgi:hypothetical protein